MIREIGSEFWIEEKINKNTNSLFQLNERSLSFLSGRTALDFIIRDAKVEKRIQKIYIPSYCCHTMIVPFIRNDIEIVFYDVYASEENGITYEIPNLGIGDALYIIKYFGYKQRYPKEVTNAKENGCLIIEDETHSYFNKTTNSSADYSYSSFRKWTYLSGIAIAKKKNSSFLIPTRNQTNIKYIDMRNKAALNKRDFIVYKKGNKEKFLKDFNQAEQLLEIDYCDYVADQDAVRNLQSINIDYIREKRRANAKVLLDGLKEINDVLPIFKCLNEEDCPLFVPILVKEDTRDELRKHLIDKEIYCPVHWPLSSEHKGISKMAHSLYSEELSLICDQRYGIDDMNRILREIKEFFTEN
jgi:hypothetical protein